MRIALDIPAGIVTDETTYSTPGLWAGGNNVRFRNGRAQAIGGWSKWHSVALTGTARNALAWADDNGMENIASGSEQALQVLSDGALYDITPTDLEDGNADTIEMPGWGDGGWGEGPWGGGELAETWPRTWSLSNYGKWLIASPRGGSIYKWELDTASPAARLANSPLSAICSLVTATRQVLAFGCEEEVSGDFNAKCIRGSDLEGIETWAATTNNNAFEFILEGPGNAIVHAARYQDIVLVWTDAAIYTGRFQDITEAPWTFELTASNCGLIGPNAFTVTNEGVWWLSPDYQFFFYQYGGVPMPVPCLVRNDLIDNIVEPDKVVCAELPQFNEIWWFYADGRDGAECSRYLGYNTAEQAWFTGEVARTAAVIRRGKPPLRINGHIYLHEDGDTADGDPLEWSLDTSAFYVSEGDREVFLKTVYPDFEGQTDTINMTIHGRYFPQQTPVDKGTYALAAGREKRDVRAKAKIVSLGFAGTGYARFGRPAIEFGQGGRR